MQNPVLDLPEELIAVLRHPTTEGAMALWPWDRLGAPVNDTVALAGIHKIRIVWRGSSKEMVRESRAWLAQHGYTP